MLIIIANSLHYVNIHEYYIKLMLSATNSLLPPLLFEGIRHPF